MDTATPRTDAFCIDNADLSDWGTGKSNLVYADQCRQLERELIAIAALRAEPVAWAVTNRGHYVAGNIFRYKSDAQMCMDNLNRLHPQETRTMVPLYAAPSRETAKPEAEPALSAEQIEVMRVLLIKVGLNPALCDMALSYLTAQELNLKQTLKIYNEGYTNGKQDTKDEGIEAAAKVAKAESDLCRVKHKAALLHETPEIAALHAAAGMTAHKIESSISALKGGK